MPIRLRSLYRPRRSETITTIRHPENERLLYDPAMIVETNKSSFSLLITKGSRQRLEHFATEPSEPVAREPVRNWYDRMAVG
jgi:hypothetical protein